MWGIRKMISLVLLHWFWSFNLSITSLTVLQELGNLTKHEATTNPTSALQLLWEDRKGDKKVREQRRREGCTCGRQRENRWGVCTSAGVRLSRLWISDASFPFCPGRCSARVHSVSTPRAAGETREEELRSAEREDQFKQQLPKSNKQRCDLLLMAQEETPINTTVFYVHVYSL